MTASLRTCCSCGKKKTKQSLQRYVWKNEKVEPDPRQILLGRGVYCCKDGQCIELFFDKKKKWKRLFRL
ncbi:DUF448 domain-containing protein [Desulfocastanea catecholica]